MTVGLSGTRLTNRAMKTFEKAKTYTINAFSKRGSPLNAEDVAGARAYINNYWRQLIRFHPKDEGSLIGLPHPYLVPSYAEGHEFDFDELFYWDSYFMIQGLWGEDNKALIVGILEDLLSLFRRFRIIPNSSQYFMTGRSQPPFLTSLILLDR